MIGGLMKTTSRFAIVAAASVLASSAFAADLGGNCCTDLEERIAELEATTARKGNRKVSLTVSGQVNEALIFWDDGVESNAYVVSNNSSRTRFRFVGSAKINPDWSAGYLLEIGVRYANSGNRNQGTNAAGGDTNTIDIRHSAWWIESKQLGRMWVGETSTASDGITEINLANVIAVGADPSAWQGGFFLRRSDNNALTARTWNQVTPSFAGAWNAGEGDRNNIVRYVSPTLQGFTFSVAWGEDDIWDIALRYAGEFNGVRVAAGIGYKETRDNVGKSGADGFACSDLDSGNVTVSATDCSAFGISGSIMHVPTGLFVTASYGRIEDDNRSRLFGYSVDDNDEHWYIQAGIEKNWFGIGKTTLYGEYGNYEAGAIITTSGAVQDLSSLGIAGNARGAGAETELWGLGINQSIDAAAMDLYLSYRNFDTTVTTTNSAGGNRANATLHEFDAVMMGGIIRF
jgi:predicted porin